MGDPMQYRITGVVINQDELPWWYVSILSWLGMVHALQQASGEIGDGYRKQLEQVLEYGAPSIYSNLKNGKAITLTGPAAVHGVYQSYVNAVEAESSSRR